jgi:addiction module HigA family antidote
MSDLFLDEDQLIALAIRELRGKRPPAHLIKPEILAFEAISIASKRPLARELTARGWTVKDLAKSLDISSSEALALVNGNAKITCAVACKLAKVFATSKEFWLAR